MTTHTLTIVDHPDDGDEPIVSLDGGTCSVDDVLLLPADTLDDEDRTALIAAVRDLTGPRDQLPEDLRDDRRIAWVPDAGDGEGAWAMPCSLRPDGWSACSFLGDWNEQDIYWVAETIVYVRPSASATEQVPLHRLRGRRLPGADGDIERVTQMPLGGWLAHHPHGGVNSLTVSLDGTVTVLKDTGR